MPLPSHLLSVKRFRNSSSSVSDWHGSFGKRFRRSLSIFRDNLVHQTIYQQHENKMPRHSVHVHRRDVILQRNGELVGFKSELFVESWFNTISANMDTKNSIKAKIMKIFIIFCFFIPSQIMESFVLINSLLKEIKNNFFISLPKQNKELSEQLLWRRSSQLLYQNLLFYHGEL